MLINKITRILAVLISLIMLFLVGCAGGKTPADSSGEPENKLPWSVTEYNESEIIDKNGSYIIEKLTNTKVAEMKQVGNKKVIYHLGTPYLFRAIHFRYDHLINAKLDEETREKTFEDGMRLIKEAGYNTVILYLGWDRFFDG